MSVKGAARKAANLVGIDVIRYHRSPQQTALGLASRDIRTVIDVGASVGEFARWIWRRLPRARIHAFEPLPGPFAALSQWAATQGGRARCTQLAPADYEGTADMHLHIEHSPSSSLLPATDPSHTIYPQTRLERSVLVSVTTLDTVVSDQLDRLPRGILLKLDVQGVEDRVLRGGRNVLDEVVARLLEITLDPLYNGQADFRTPHADPLRGRTALRGKHGSDPLSGRTRRVHRCPVREGMTMDWAAVVKKAVLQTSAVGRIAAPYCSDNGLLPSVLTRTPAASLRNLLFLPPSPFETQLNQDVFALIVNRFATDSFFVEIGANDGFTLSNTVYLEEAFGWSGIVVEANPEYRASLEKRKALSVIAAVTAEEGYHDFIPAGLYGGLSESMDQGHESQWSGTPKVSVWGTTLGRILDSGGAPSLINFISVDVEGGEVPIVEQLCSLERYRFVCGCIEHNRRASDLSAMSALLSEAGYLVVWPGQTQQDLFFIDGQRWPGL